MNYQTILYTVSDNVATITLNRPDVMNGLNAQMRADITHAIGRAGDDARVLVLTGAGRGFCSGQDLGDGEEIRCGQGGAPFLVLLPRISRITSLRVICHSTRVPSFSKPKCWMNIKTILINMT